MASVRELADRRYRTQVALTKTTTRATVALWRRLDPADLNGSWFRTAPFMLGLVAAAQTRAAEGADEYTDAVLREQGIDPDRAGSVVPGAFSGFASDGRPLESLLYSPVTVVKTGIGAGASVARSMQMGEFSLRLIAATQVADAGRVAGGVAVAARPKVGGYVRMLTPPSCARCAILAGRYYRWSAGFQRHPRCDCIHIPAAENIAGDLTTSPMEAFRKGQITDLSTAEASAIREGSDISQVVNAKKGIYTAGGRQFTHAGRTVHGVRLTPEQVYRDATSRDDAVRLLRLHGYII